VRPRHVVAAAMLAIIGLLVVLVITALVVTAMRSRSA
jgi:hypothetical protein